MKSPPRTSASPPSPFIPWGPWGLSLVLLGNTRHEQTIRLEGELAGVRLQVAGCLKELAV